MARGIIAQYAAAHRQYYPQDGWVEHDAVEIYNNVKAVIRGVVKEAGIAPPPLQPLH